VAQLTLALLAHVPEKFSTPISKPVRAGSQWYQGFPALHLSRFCTRPGVLPFFAVINFFSKNSLF
jgi:hypothetical protein